MILFFVLDLTIQAYYSVNGQFQAITGINFLEKQSKSKESGRNWK